MKRVSIFVGTVLFILISYAMMHLSTKKEQKKQGNKTGFAVVELFTSEGCSSCPPADEAVADLLNDSPAHVYVLGFHVDYWNRLGWKDAYSSSEFSKRQQQYSNALHLAGIYTPQAIVNGKTEFTGSDTRKLHAAVEDGLQSGDAQAITISAKSGDNEGDNKTVNVSYQFDAANKSVLNIALVQLHAQSNVQKGENSGKQLHHVNVVRGFTSVTGTNGKGEVTLPLAEGLAVENCKIIAYLQDAGSWKITGATSVEIKVQGGFSSTRATIFSNRIYFRAYLNIFAAIYSGI